MSKTVRLDVPEHIEKMTISGRKHNKRLSVIPKHIKDQETGERLIPPEAMKAISKIHNERFVSFKDQVENAKNVCTEYLVNAFKDDHINFRSSKEFGDEVDGKFDNKGFKSFYHYLIQGLGNAHDSLEALLAELLFCIDVMQAEKADIDLRLEYAVKFGEQRFKIFNLFIPESKVQSDNGSRPRTIEEIQNIFKKLKIRKANGEKAKELWPTFVADMEDFIEPQDDGNPNNPKSWKITYKYYNSRGEEKHKKMTFSTFQNRLNTKK